MNKIIGFVGFKQVGKSTAARYLEETHGFVRHNFKDALVAELKENFPDLLVSIMETENDMRGYLNDVGIPTKELCFEDLFTEKPPLVRTLMQNYGTEVRRKDKDSYWTDKWVTKLWKLGSDKDVVVDDVRFLNEASRVKGQGGVLIRLTRADIPTGGNHPSETEQLEIEADYTIEGEPGNPQNMYKVLDMIVANMI